MQLRLFGGLAATVAGTPVPLGPPKQRLVLAALAVEANQVVSIDRLIDVLWGDRPPNDPAASLQVYVSNLRRALEPNRGSGPPEVLCTQAPGYRLVVAADELDVSRVERLVAEGLAAARAGAHELAVTHLRGALDQSAEAPVPELADRPMGVALHARWAAQRGAAIEALIDAQLALGLHAEVAAAMPRWLVEHPHREHLRAQHALALYRDGRQVEALRSIDDTRRLLAEDVGLSMSTELHALEARILDHDPSLDFVPEPAGAGAPADVGVAAGGRARGATATEQRDVEVPPAARRPATALHGRTKELDGLLLALDRASDGHGSSVVVSGEPGIGKTRLVQELVHLAASRGFAIGWGRCPESGATPSFWAANQIAEQLLRAGALDAQLFGLLPQHVPEEASTEGAKRFALQVLVSDALRSVECPLLLVIDDLQWADAATLALLEFVAGELAALRVLVVVTTRPIGPESPRPLVECLGELARQRDTVQLRLAGLDAGAVGSWMHGRPGGAVPPRVVELVHDRSGGNPFYLGELIELLESEGRLHDPRLDRAGTSWVPAAVQDVVRRRVSRLPADVQKLLSIASVVGRSFDVDVLAVVADVEQLRLLDLLDTACRSGLVGEAEVPGRFSFSHALVAEALVAELTAARRAAVHAAVVAAIERLRAGDLEAHAAELAHHAHAAIAVGMARQAYDYSVRAARLATSIVAHEDAVVHWARALQSLDAMRSADDAARYDVLVRLGSTQLILDDVLSASRNLLAAARIAQRSGDHVAAARAVAELNHASLWEPNNYQERDESLTAFLEAVLDALPAGNDEPRARVVGALAAELHHVDEVRRVALADESVALARCVGDPELLVRALNNRNFAHHTAEGLPVRLEVARELRLLLAEHAVNDELRALAWAVIACAEREAGDAVGARRVLASAAAAAERSGSMTLLAQIRFTQATTEVSAGHLERARELAASANEIYRRGRGFSADTIQAGTMLHAYLETAGAPAVVALMEQANGETYANQWTRVLAWVHVEAGDLDAARSALATAEAMGPLPRDWTWLVTALFTAVVQAALDDRAGAAASYDALLPFAGRLALAGTNSPVFDAADSALAVLAACIGDHAAAERHFADALACNERAGARVWLARTLVWHGRWHLQQGRRDAAMASLDRARALADEIGSVQVVALVERALTGASAS